MLLEQLKFEEGLRLKTYLCTAGKRTIGYGRNLDANPYFEGNKIPDEITKDEAEAILAHDIDQVTKQLVHRWTGFTLLDEVRRDALINMAFQMGVDGLLGFKMMHKALLKGDWRKACNEALDSQWGKTEELRPRSMRVAGQFLTGLHYKV